MNFHINFACDLTNTNINFINIKYVRKSLKQLKIRDIYYSVIIIILSI